MTFETLILLPWRTSTISSLLLHSEATRGGGNPVPDISEKPDVSHRTWHGNLWGRPSIYTWNLLWVSSQVGQKFNVSMGYYLPAQKIPMDFRNKFVPTCKQNLKENQKVLRKSTLAPDCSSRTPQIPESTPWRSLGAWPSYWSWSWSPLKASTARKVTVRFSQ